VIVAQQMKGTVHRQQSELNLDRMAGLGSLDNCARVGDDRVSQVKRLPRGLDKGRIGDSGKSQDIRGGIYVAELPVKLVDLFVAGDDEGERCPSRCAPVTQRRRCRVPQTGFVNLAGITWVYLDSDPEGRVFAHGHYAPLPVTFQASALASASATGSVSASSDSGEVGVRRSGYCTRG